MKKIISVFLTICLLCGMCGAFAASAGDFADVSGSAWYYGSVDYCVSNGLFSGSGNGKFSPDVSMTRGMFVTVLGRYAGVSGQSGVTAKIDDSINMRSGPGLENSVVVLLRPGDTVTVSGIVDGWYSVGFAGKSGYIRQDLITPISGQFTDVKADSYYAGYVNWAYSAGIVSGTGGTTFSPDRAISRQEICAILYRYAGIKNLTLSPAAARVEFADGGSIAAGFTEAVYAMQEAGIISGRGANMFYPRETASRAEVSSILMRFIENIKLAPKPDYSFSGTVPQSQAVSESYFDDACFIGHSIVVGMRSYFDLLNADYFAENGISAKRLLEYDGFELPSGNTGTIANAMAERSYGKVYIMLGANELGGSAYDSQIFYDSMCSLIELIKTAQPGASVYIISITPVTQALSESSGNFTLSNIVSFNQRLQQVSVEKGAGYLDFFTLFADEDGYMPPDGAAGDGLHPVQSQYQIMRDYLMTHTY